VQRNRPGRFRCRPNDRSRPAATQRPARTCRGAGFPLMDAKPNMNTARTQSVPCGGRAASGWCLQAGYDGAARGRFRYRAAKGPRGGVEQDRDFQVRAVGRSASFDMARIETRIRPMASVTHYPVTCASRSCSLRQRQRKSAADVQSLVQCLLR
jgi:hypothetical protein